MNLKAAFAGAALSLSFAGGALAHHSFAMFDMGKEQTITGTVVEFQWVNPHSWLVVAVKDPAGKETVWHIEGSHVPGLVRAGWHKDSVKPGDKVEVTINPLRTGEPGGNMRRVSVDGKVIGRQQGG
jgi:hypothetical protein